MMNLLLGAVFMPETTKETYIYINELLSIISVDETVREYYCIFSALESLYDIYSIRRLTPVINKEVVMQIIENNLYGELKENTTAGFKEYARVFCSTELDSFNEKSISVVYNTLITSIGSIIDVIVKLNYTIEDSLAAIPAFLQHYGDCLSQELSEIISLLNTNDSKVLYYQYSGWSDFLRRHRISNILHLSKLLRLVSALYDNKVYISKKETAPLTSLSQLIIMEDEYIKSDIPLGIWDIPILDQLISIKPHEVTVVVGERGLGKTTWGGFIAGKMLAQNRKVLFYCPEIKKYKLFFNFILPPYIKAKYNFLMSPDQCLGRETPYTYGSDLSAEEKAEVLKVAKQTLAESGLFYHVDINFEIKTLAEDLRSRIIEFEPDIIIFDHTQEIRGENNMNVVTQVLADVFEEIKRDFPVHIFALSHTGSEFTVPTRDKPIITSKIVAWSKRMEGAADNIIGAFPSAGDCINFFTTKLRWAQLIPMYLVFRMDKKHGWFNFRKEDQFSNQITDEQIRELAQIETEEAWGLEPEEDADGFMVGYEEGD